MYDRNYDGKTLNFEPSGGLMNASLVMQDKETDTYWSIMSGKAEAGELNGTTLTELPVSDKMSWAEWVARHPDTLVLSVMRTASDGTTVAVQDPGGDRYGNYFASPSGFRLRSDDGPREIEATDPRLDTKDQIHAFLHQDVPYAVDLRRVVGGRAYELNDGTYILVYREATDEMFRGSAAFMSPAGFENRGGSWFETGTGAEFNAITRDFGGAAVERLNGFDTFWYTWSLTHADTELLR